MQDIDQQSSVAPKSQARRQNWQTENESKQADPKPARTAAFPWGATLAPGSLRSHRPYDIKPKRQLWSSAASPMALSQADAVFAYGRSVCDKQGDEHDGSR